MRKTFIISVSFLHLVSGIGFGSMKHYCHNFQKMISQSDTSCCSSETIADATASCQKLEEAKVHCCRDMMPASEPIRNVNTIFSGDCCDIELEFNQPENSVLPISFHVSHVTQSCDEFYDYPQYPQIVIRSDLTSFSDPSRHINLPLII